VPVAHVQSTLVEMSRSPDVHEIDWPDIKFGPINLWNMPNISKVNKMLRQCVSHNCINSTIGNAVYCDQCIAIKANQNRVMDTGRTNGRRMSDMYPKYYKPVPEGIRELDVYAVCKMFPVDDPSGAINHARKKLLVPGARTGGKSMYNDIKEARDTLERWLELNKVPLDSPESFAKATIEIDNREGYIINGIAHIPK
jgi:hypothetical protein